MLTMSVFVSTAGQVTYRVVQVTQNEDGETQVVTASPFPPDTQVTLIELRHSEVHHFVIEECSHLANGCTTKCGCLGLILFRYLSFRGTVKCHI